MSKYLGDALCNIWDIPILKFFFVFLKFKCNWESWDEDDDNIDDDG